MKRRRAAKAIRAVEGDQLFVSEVLMKWDVIKGLTIVDFLKLVLGGLYK